MKNHIQKSGADQPFDKEISRVYSMDPASHPSRNIDSLNLREQRWNKVKENCPISQILQDLMVKLFGSNMLFFETKKE